MLNIILMGPPGSGKGTQAKNIYNYYNYKHIDIGNILRNNILNKNITSKILLNNINNGVLINDDFIIKIVKENINFNKGYVFDGIPRTINQAVMLNDLLHSKQQFIDLVLLFNIDYDNILYRIFNRLKIEKRKDDNNDIAINNRIKEFYDKTFPIINFYKKNTEVFNINGNKSSSEIFNKIINIIDDKLINKNAK